MLKYDHDKLTDILLDEYQKKYGTYGKPSASMTKLIDCMDDAFVDEWVKDVSKIDESISKKASETLRKANDALNMLRNEIAENNETSKEAKEALAIHDERVADALKAYQTIVNMEFDTPQQKLQNIQNASYFVWALYFQSGNASNMFFRDIKNGEVSNVKEEDSSSSHDYFSEVI